MGFLDTFLGTTGKKQALDTLQQTQKQAGLQNTNNVGFAQGGYDNALARYDPYARQGQQANAQYGNFLGLNGADAQQGALGAYNAYNPYLQAEQDRITRGLDRRAAATGNRGSGFNALAQARALDESSFRNYSDYLNRLQGQQGMGLQVAGSQAGLDQGNMANRIGIENQYRNTLMGAQNQYSQQYNQAATGGLQNILGAVGTGINVAGMMMGKPPTLGGANNLAYNDPGTFMNGGWTTTARRA